MMLANISSTQYAEMLSRLNRNAIRLPKSGEPVEREADLHDHALSYCESRRKFYAHSRMDERHPHAVGAPAK